MLCVKCKKNQATKTYIRAVGGREREEYYCLTCYHKNFLDVSLADKGEKVCPYCGRTAAEVKRTSIVGCARCYETLKGAVFPLLTGMQGTEAHRGKSASATTEREIVELRLKELLALIESYQNTGDTQRAKSCFDEYNKLNDYLRGGGKHGEYTGIY